VLANLGVASAEIFGMVRCSTMLENGMYRFSGFGKRRTAERRQVI
jgi:hypothetical protein